jgi:glycosyltransferase involved in cell wall biosynthesis
MAELTIAIPTYDRNAKLLRAVRGLLPQLDSRCRLVILDNHSPTPAGETLRELLSGYPDVDCRVIRHPVNIGGNANIMRCFEVCDTPWLWVLGDDDEVDRAGIATIFETIETYPDLIYVNYGPPGNGRTQTTLTVGQEEFARAIDVFTHANFISACLYNHAALRARLHYAVQYAYSCAPQSLIVLMSIGSSGCCMFSHRKIAHWSPPEPGQHGDVSLAWRGFPTILEGQMPAAVRLLMARAMLKERPSVRELARELYYAARRNHDFATSRFLYDHITYRLLYFDARVPALLKTFIGRLPLLFPNAFEFLNRSSARVMRRRINRLVPSARTE